MKRYAPYIYSIIQAAVLMLSYFFIEWHVPLLFILSITVLLSVLNKLGKGIVLRELIVLHGCLICLVMPQVGYTWYTIENPLAKLWVRYMFVPAETYFGFALPAMAGFALTLCYPINSKGVSDEGAYITNYINKAKLFLQTKKNLGLKIIIIGLLVSFAVNLLPGVLQYPAILFYWGSFAGFLYVYFSPASPYRMTILVSFVVLIFARSLQIGMFTVVAYMGITIFSFLFLGRRSKLWKKLSIFILGIFFLFIIQSVKNTYRQSTWSEGYTGSKAGLFGTLIVEKLSKFDELFSQTAMFPIYSRTNQGWNISLVLRRFPAVKDFDNGTNLMRSAASSLVPRFLWPDKPEAGGMFNMEYYADFKIFGYSTNVGPLGEAYGSFGVNGGIIYMFFLGLFVRWAYMMVFKVSRKIPLIIFWIPIMFYEVTYSSENDTLQILNSLIKSSFFIVVIYQVFPLAFGKIKKNKFFRKPQTLPGIEPGQNIYSQPNA